MKTVTVAAIQMSSVNGDVPANLQKAQSLAAQATAAGAELVVLPEFFNIGYSYTDANYRLAELGDGPTCRWFKETAASLGVHLAGSFMLRKGGEILNTLLLAAPDGRTWEYDKLNPWGWERAYFRPGEGPVVAETDLGRLGFLICWDVGYPHLFRAYAGKVQMLVISSCPPRMNHLEIDFPNGRTAAIADISFLVGVNRDRGDAIMNEDLRAQGAWLGVPLVNAMHHGLFSSPVPRPGMSLGASLLLNPRHWHLLSHAGDVVIRAPQNEHTLIAAADGRELARAGEGDTFALAQVEVPDEPPRPTGPQPKMVLHPFAYVMHMVLNWIVKPLYDQHVQG